MKLMTLAIIVSTLIMNGCTGASAPLPSSPSSYRLSEYENTIYHEVDKNSVGNVEIFSKKLSFKEVDGHSYESMFVVAMNRMVVDKYQSIVLKPGHHRIKFYYNVYFIRTASINFQQGHKYLFDAEITRVSQNQSKASIWVYDLTDKRVVWGSKPDKIKYR